MMQDILKLSVSERILMVEAIWDSIADNSKNIEVSEETKQLLDDRLKEHNESKEEGASWIDVKKRIKKQL
ncbi:addiction module protein [Plebeiibacterium marinum]|uniref:Addiction module protein n=1 Tax=Plebeiibacterium marinum TaxID=2992111 RepID=A0AAE3MGP7_9BACT|nr:addiction module protein [Plebeiobacterium marinum]MCW3807166.1 addiction module protein [Plebeiobacterium marinum]